MNHTEDCHSHSAASIARRLPAAMPTQAECKCCGAQAGLAGFVDFARDCHGVNRKRNVVSGVPVPYYRCASCEFAFTDGFDDWSHEEFREHVYNDEYALFDPRFADERPREVASMIVRLFKQRHLRVLDYGGGNGRMAELLREAGFAEVVSYDPFHAQQERPEMGGFDLVTCIEVAEHSPTPLALFAELHAYTAPHGVILLSTQDFGDVRGHWVDNWYVAPRNGHISFYTSRTLGLIAASLQRTHHKLDTYRHLLTPIAGNA